MAGDTAEASAQTAPGQTTPSATAFDAVVAVGEMEAMKRGSTVFGVPVSSVMFGAVVVAAFFVIIALVYLARTWLCGSANQPTVDSLLEEAAPVENGNEHDKEGSSSKLSWFVCIGLGGLALLILIGCFVFKRDSPEPKPNDKKKATVKQVPVPKHELKSPPEPSSDSVKNNKNTGELPNLQPKQQLNEKKNSTETEPTISPSHSIRQNNTENLLPNQDANAPSRTEVFQQSSADEEFDFSSDADESEDVTVSDPVDSTEIPDGLLSSSHSEKEDEEGEETNDNASSVHSANQKYNEFSRDRHLVNNDRTREQMLNNNTDHRGGGGWSAFYYQ